MTIYFQHCGISNMNKLYIVEDDITYLFYISDENSSDLWPWKSIGFQILLRTKYVPSLVKIHWRMLILECSQGYYEVNIWPGDLDFWPMTLKINRVRDPLKD
jgi:hypothetical protein